MAQRNLPRHMSFSDKGLRWFFFAGTSIALGVLLSLVLKTAFDSKTIDQFTVITIALAAGSVRMMFLFLKWYKSDCMFLLNLLTGLIPFIAAYLNLMQTDDNARLALVPYLFGLSLSALLLSVVLNSLDARDLQPSVWMWKERTWWVRKLDREVESDRIAATALASAIQKLETGAANKRRKNAGAVAIADEAAAAQIKLLLALIQPPLLASTSHSRTLLATAAHSQHTCLRSGIGHLVRLDSTPGDF